MIAIDFMRKSLSLGGDCWDDLDETELDSSAICCAEAAAASDDEEELLRIAVLSKSKVQNE